MRTGCPGRAPGRRTPACSRAEIGVRPEAGQHRGVASVSAERLARRWSRYADVTALGSVSKVSAVTPVSGVSRTRAARARLHGPATAAQNDLPTVWGQARGLGEYRAYSRRYRASVPGTSGTARGRGAVCRRRMKGSSSMSRRIPAMLAHHCSRICSGVCAGCARTAQTGEVVHRPVAATDVGVRRMQRLRSQARAWCTASAAFPAALACGAAKGSTRAVGAGRLDPRPVEAAIHHPL